MTPKLTLLFLLLIVFAAIVRENLRVKPDAVYQTVSGQVEMCLACHKTERLDAAHAPSVVGCSPCHLGDPMAAGKEAAHRGIVKNPGDLRVADKSCGVEDCHAPDIHKVKNTLMATNRGILATMLYYWKEAPDQYSELTVEELLATGKNSFTLDYYRKLCATCHLWKQRGDLDGLFGEKGGGCTACHLVPQNDEAAAAGQAGAKKPHPLIIRKVPMENCVRCHNRSGRIGLAYQGQFESEGYGTPHEAGGLSSKQYPDGRFYQQLTPDVHHEKGMVCIDCHTRNEVMGDGTRYAHYEEQLEITCQSCHTAGEPGTTRKGNALNNVKRGKDGAFRLIGKLDDKPRPLAAPKAGACDYPLHRRLSCEACHSAWAPQCYGCHVKLDKGDTDLDKLTLKETPGWWVEGRSYLRYEEPALALWDDEVVVVVPGCQDIVTIVGESGKPEAAFNSLTYAALNPHTTRKESRGCAACHANPKTLGLGEGRAWREEGRWRFAPVSPGVETAAGPTPPLDALVSIEGTPLQRTSRAAIRPFNAGELGRILRVGECLPCHTAYDDPAFTGYTPERKCPRKPEL